MKFSIKDAGLVSLTTKCNHQQNETYRSLLFYNVFSFAIQHWTTKSVPNSNRHQKILNVYLYAMLEPNFQLVTFL